MGEPTAYSELFRNTRPVIDKILNRSYNWNGSRNYRKPLYKGVGERLMNGAIEMANYEGFDGIGSGFYLNKPEATLSTWKHYPVKSQIGNTGMHTYSSASSAPITTFNGPIMSLNKPSYPIMLKSVNFDPKIIDSNGMMHIDWNNMVNPLRATMPIGVTYGLYKNN